jgi:hypothetical protein
MPEAVDRPADVDRVYEELKRAIDRDARDPATMRGLAERFWPVSADKPLERRAGRRLPPEPFQDRAEHQRPKDEIILGDCQRIPALCRQLSQGQLRHRR